MSSAEQPASSTILTRIKVLEDTMSLVHGHESQIETLALEVHSLRSEVNDLRAEMNQRFDLMDKRFEEMEKKLDRRFQKTEDLLNRIAEALAI